MSSAPEPSAAGRITVLGIGNILYRDEGAGIGVILHLAETYDFPDNVRLVDGGTTGLHGLMPLIEETSRLIVVDIVNGEDSPGEIRKYDPDTFRKVFAKKLSMHDVGFLECLAVADLTGKKPDSVVIIGIQPADFKSWEIGTTPEVERGIEKAGEMVLAELEKMGVRPMRKPAGKKSTETELARRIIDGRMGPGN